MKVRAAVGGALLASLAIAVSACGSSESSAPDSSSVSVALGSNPTTDPARESNIADGVVARGLYDTLVRVDGSGEIVGGLASSWEQTPRSVTLRMRDDVTCEDGTRLTPEAAAASLRRLHDPRTAAPYASHTFGPSRVTIEADDAAGTLRVSTSEPWSPLLVGLSMPWAGIVCPEGIKNPERLSRESFGTGPYTLASFEPNRRLKLEAREDYDWAPRLSGIQEGTKPRDIELQIVENESTMVNLLLSGKLDVAQLLGEDVARVADDPRFEVTDEAAGTIWVAFNEARDAMKSERTRRAVSQAIDRDAFVQSATLGRGEVIPSPVPPTAQCFSDATEVPEFDVAAARAGLQGAPRMRIIGTTQLADGVGTQYLQEALRAAGVDAELRNSDTTTWSGALTSGTGDWDLTVVPQFNIGSSITSPISLMTGAAPPRGSNFGDAQSPEVAAALRQAMAAIGEEGCDAWAEVQAGLVDGVHILPLSTFPVSIATRAGVSAPAPTGGVPDVGMFRVR